MVKRDDQPVVQVRSATAQVAHQVLLISDDARRRNLLYNILSMQNYEVALASYQIRDHDDVLASLHPTVTLLDSSVEPAKGIALCAHLRHHCNEPMILLGLPHQPGPYTRGLKAGADICLPDPLDSGLILAQVKNVIRRLELCSTLPIIEGGGRVGDVMMFGPLVIDSRTQQATYNGTKISMLPREFALFEYLARHRTRPISREELYRVLLKKPQSPSDRSIDVRVSGLRSKLTKAGVQGAYVHTIHGKGYRFSPPPA